MDSDYSVQNKTRGSRSGFFVLLNIALIQWFTKKQATIYMYVFGAEFVAVNIVMENLHGIIFNLRMMGVPIAGPSYIYGDNMSVIHNTQHPKSNFEKEDQFYILSRHL